ncbi:MAG: diacylglycerol kinase [Synoicihabitans sp.]
MSSSLSDRCKSFVHACRGAVTLIATQPNARIHLAVTLLVLLLAVLLEVDRLEWVAFIGAMGLVWMAEALNTAIEFLADEVSLEFRDRIKQAKDVAAFGVLAASIAAAAIGLMVFAPKLSRFEG